MNIMEIAMERGIEQGMERGIEQGMERGEERLNLLYEKLLFDKRMDDIRRSMKDREYRKRLYTEYRI